MSNESNNDNGCVMGSLDVFFLIILPLLVLKLGRTHILAIMLISIIIGISYAALTIEANTSIILNSIILLTSIIGVISIVNNSILDILSFIIPLLIGLAGTYITYYIKNNAVNANINKNDNTYFTI